MRAENTPTGNAFQRFFKLGYSGLLPVVPPDGGIAKAGKRPGVKHAGRWVGKASSDFAATPYTIAAWHDMGASVGVSCDGTGVCGVDIDSLTEWAAKIKQIAFEMLGVTTVRIGQAPKLLLLYRCAPDTEYRQIRFDDGRPPEPNGKGFIHKAALVELIAGATKWFVAWGIHPDTRKPYTWPGGVPCFDVLPRVSAEQLKAFFERLAAELPKAVASGSSGKDRAAVDQDSLKGDLDLVEDAMARLPNEVVDYNGTYVPMAAALRGACQDDPDRGCDIFINWSEKLVSCSEEDKNSPDRVYWSLRPPFALGASYIYDKAHEAKWVGDWFDKSAAAPDANANADGEGRQKPMDPFGDGDATALAEPPPDALPKVVDDFARDVAGRLGCPTAFVAAAALATICGTIGTKYRIQPHRLDDEWTEKALLWFAIVEDPGGKKSPAIKAAVKPLRVIEARHRGEDEKRLAVWKSAKKAGGDPGPEPRKRRYTAQNFTMEGLREVLVGSVYGILIHQDELTAMIGRLDAYKSTKGADRADMLELYEGNPLSVDRAKNSYDIPCWGASVIGGIQPRKMTEMAPNLEADGFLPRFLPIKGDGKHRASVNREPDRQARKCYYDLIDSLADLCPPFSNPVKLSSEAEAVWESLAQHIEMLGGLPDMSDAWSAHLGKWPGFSARLLLVAHVVEVAGKGDGSQPDDVEVTAETATRTVRLVEWLLGHAIDFYTNCVGRSEASEDARWIAGYILAQGKPRITRRDIGQVYLRGKDDRIAKAFHYLFTMGWLRPADDYPDRLGSKRWDVNPQVFSEFAPRAETEKRKRAEAKGKIEKAADERRRILRSRPSDA